jgi:hypothetical protein
MTDLRQAVDQWVLVGTYDDGSPKYHAATSHIGPRSTRFLSEAEVFPSREAACQSRGFTHWSSNASPMLLSEARQALDPQQ